MSLVRYRLFQCLVIVTSIVVVGCGSNGTPTGPDANAAQTCGGNMGTVRATIDGRSYNFGITSGTYFPRSNPTSAERFTVIASTCEPASTQVGISLSIRLTQETVSARSYPFSNSIATLVDGGVGRNPANAGERGATWDTSEGNDPAGTITLTTFTASRAVGTFVYTAPAKPGTPATGSRSVTNGSFDLNYVTIR